MTDCAISEMAEAREAFFKNPASSASSKSAGSSVSSEAENGIAKIHISGTMFNRAPSYYAYYDIPHAEYSDIIAAVERANSNAGVKEIELHINSGGGEVSGLIGAVNAIKLSSKPVIAVADQACSAAYALASACGSIYAKDAMSSFGSIGVKVAVYENSDCVEISSTESPKKVADPSTDEGKSEIRAYLDQMHEIFAGWIADGRKVTVDHVNASYGRGSVMLTAKALELGMVEGIYDSKPKVTVEKPGQNALGGVKEKIKAAAALSERERIKEHVSAAGDLALAKAGIESGEQLTAKWKVKYTVEKP